MITYKDCEECRGEGQVHIDTSYQCQKPMSNCCGGCGYMAKCEECDGTGEVEDYDEEE